MGKNEDSNALIDLEYIMNGINAMICVTNPETDDLLFINDSMKRAFNTDPDYIGQKCYKILRGKNERCDFCPCNRLDSEPDREITWEHAGEYDGTRTYRFISKYIKWPGDITVHIQTAIDITDIKEAERDIAEKNEFNQNLFDHSPVGLTIFDKNYGYVDCNDQILKMFGGITREQYAKFFGSDDHSPEYQPDGQKSRDKAMSLINMVIKDGKTVKTEFVHKKPNGEILPVDLTLTRIKQGDRYIGLGFVYDMSEQTELREKLTTALREAENASKAKSNFLARMSHEIRTPMNAILGVTEIQMRNGNLSEDTEEALSKIYESGTLLMSIINDILDLSKIEADKLELIPVKYDIMSLVNDTAQLHYLRSNNDIIGFEINLDPDTPRYLTGDELRIKQILNNILSNAFKYTQKGKIEFSVKSVPFDPKMSARNNCIPKECDVMLVFRVSDTGQGLSEEQQSLLFTDYTRFNVETNRTTAGTGLGLSITKRLTNMMGGDIAVESELGKGSVFTVSIPQERNGSDVCGTEQADKLNKMRVHNSTLAKKTQFVREYMPYGSVLIVDDVESNTYVAKGMLLPYGLKIDTASSGFEVIEKIENGNEYDIIFMDHMMPKMDGVETTNKIREMGYSAPIVALTANAVIGQSDMLLNNGFDGFVSKPIDSRELNHILNELIRNKKPKDVVEAARREQAERQESTKNRGSRGKNTTAKSSEISVRDDEMKRLVLRDAAKAADLLEKIYIRINAVRQSAETLSDEETEMYIITVHGMKSALANFGEPELSAISQRLELAGKDRDYEIIADETPGYIAMLRMLIEKHNGTGAEVHVKADTTQDTQQEDTAFLTEALQKINTACLEYNISDARVLLSDIKQKIQSSHIREALEDLNTHLLHSDFEAAAAAAGEMISAISTDRAATDCQ